MPGVVYDAGALIAADRGDEYMLAAHERLVRLRIKPVVPLIVFAQAWRGGPQPALSRVLKGCQLIAEDLPTAKTVGEACGAARTSDVVDALVVVVAVQRGAAVVTSDPGDIRAIADALGAKITIHSV